MSSAFPQLRLVALTLGFLVSACDTGPVRLSSDGTVKPGRLAAAQELIDGDFENGLASWYDCSKNTPIASTDSAAGQSAMRLPHQSCAYQTVQSDPTKTYKLSCQTKRSGTGWAALTLAYLDENYRTLHQEEVSISSSAYKQTSISLNAMRDATYVEVLAYSEQAALLIDECSLESTAAHPGIVSNPIQDGAFPNMAEISKQQAFSYDPRDTADSDIDWKQGWLVHNDLGYFLAWNTHTELPSHTWGLGVYLDTDQNRNTGFRGFNDEFPIGVDYLIEGVEQFSYTGTGTDWSWELTKMAGSDVQFIPKSDVGNPEQLDLFFLANSASVGGKSIDYYPDSLMDVNATPARRYFTYDATTQFGGESNPTVTDPEVIVVVDPDPADLNPPVTADPETPIAKIDVRLNLEGHETWNVTDAANFPSQIYVKNTGNVTLTNIKVNESQACIFNYNSLEPGESRLEICETPVGNSHYQHAIVSAIAPDGQEVRDDDSTKINTYNQFAKNLASVNPDNPVVNIGDTVTIDVQVASSGIDPENRITQVVSNVDSCNRDFNPPVALDSMAEYQCVVEANQLPLNIDITAVSANSSVVNSTRIVEAGVPTLQSTEPYPVSVDLFRQRRSIENVGAVDISNVTVTGRNMDCVIQPLSSPAVDSIASIPSGERSSDIVCAGEINGRGVPGDTALIVAGTTPDGQSFETVLESTLTNSRDTNLTISLADSNSRLIKGAPNESVVVNFRLENRGYLAASEISLEKFNTVLNDPENLRSMRFNPNPVIPPEINAENCISVMNAITNQPNFSLAAGDAIELACSIQIPPSNVFLHVVTNFKTTRDEVSGSAGYFRVVAEEAATNSPTIVERIAPADAGSLPNPTISADRVVQILENSDFEATGTDAIPARWTPGCNSGASSTSGYYGKSIGLRSQGCATYVLDSNELAMLSGNGYNVGCEMTSTARSRRSSQQYASLSITLNGTESKADSEYAQGYFQVSDDAPTTATEGFISLYTNGTAEFDNCQLTITGATDNNASINVSNNIEGVDVYNRSQPLDFLISVANDGQTALQNIEVSSSRFACDRNYPVLQAGESVEFFCTPTSDALTHWDDRMSHVVTATADSASGLVTDSDFSGYGNLYTIERRNFLSVTANSQPLDQMTPVAIGSDIEFEIVTVQQQYTPTAQVVSSIPSCNRTPGDYVKYTCTLENIQETTTGFIDVVNAGQTYVEGSGAFTIAVQ